MSGGGGIRTPPENPGKTAFSEKGGADSGAVTLSNFSNDSDLALIINAWPNLPEAIRAGILAIIRAAGG
jgi:hypothetical protein